MKTILYLIVFVCAGLFIAKKAMNVDVDCGFTNNPSNEWMLTCYASNFLDKK